MGKDVATLLKVLELIEAGAGWRQQHHIARLHARRKQTHRLFHGFSLFRNLRSQSGKLCAIAAKAVQTNVVAGQVTLQRHKVSGFSVAAQQQVQRAVNVQAIQRGFSAADVGRF